MEEESWRRHLEEALLGALWALEALLGALWAGGLGVARGGLEPESAIFHRVL